MIALIAGLADRLRGMGVVRPLMLLIYGYTIAVCLGHSFTAWTLPIVILFLLGITPGWGNPVGAGLMGYHNPKDWESKQGKANTAEWWQFGILRKSTYLALVFRGFMVGLPLLLIAYWVQPAVYVCLTYSITFPISVFVGRIVNGKNPSDTGNVVNELLRGSLSVLILTTAV